MQAVRKSRGAEPRETNFANSTRQRQREQTDRDHQPLQAELVTIAHQAIVVFAPSWSQASSPWRRPPRPANGRSGAAFLDDSPAMAQYWRLFSAIIARPASIQLRRVGAAHHDQRVVARNAPSTCEQFMLKSAQSRAERGGEF